jgi:hypothetical protein
MSSALVAVASGEGTHPPNDTIDPTDRRPIKAETRFLPTSFIAAILFASSANDHGSPPNEPTQIPIVLEPSAALGKAFDRRAYVEPSRGRNPGEGDATATVAAV